MRKSGRVASASSSSGGTLYRPRAASLSLLANQVRSSVSWSTLLRMRASLASPSSMSSFKSSSRLQTRSNKSRAERGLSFRLLRKAQYIRRKPCFLFSIFSSASVGKYDHTMPRSLVRQLSRKCYESVKRRSARCVTDSPEKIASCCLRIIAGIRFVMTFVKVVFLDPNMSSRLAGQVVAGFRLSQNHARYCRSASHDVPSGHYRRQSSAVWLHHHLRHR